LGYNTPSERKEKKEKNGPIKPKKRRERLGRTSKGKQSAHIKKKLGRPRKEAQVQKKKKHPFGKAPN